MGLPSSMQVTNEWVRVRLSTDSFHVRVTSLSRKVILLCPFGEACQHLKPYFVTIVQRFTYVIHTIQPIP